MPKKKLYSPNQNELFQISRSNIQSFLECPKCFYLQIVRGIKKPSGLPLPINMAIDSILKNLSEDLLDKGFKKVPKESILQHISRYINKK